MEILLAFNGSKLSESALHAVITQRRPENTKVKVLKVVPLDVTEEEVRQASLDLTAQALRTAGFKAESTVLRDIVIESNRRRSRRMGCRPNRAGLARKDNSEAFLVWERADGGDTCCSVLRRACEVSS
jgi:hypothetical protein